MTCTSVQPTGRPWIFRQQGSELDHSTVDQGNGRWLLTFSQRGVWPSEPLEGTQLANAKRIVPCVSTHDDLVQALRAAIAGSRAPDTWLAHARFALDRGAAIPDDLPISPVPWTFHEQGEPNEWCLLTADKRGWVLGFRQNGELTRVRQLANARFIVRAVNKHAEVLDALRAAVEGHRNPETWLPGARSTLDAIETAASRAEDEIAVDFAAAEYPWERGG